MADRDRMIVHEFDANCGNVAHLCELNRRAQLCAKVAAQTRFVYEMQHVSA